MDLLLHAPRASEALSNTMNVILVLIGVLDVRLIMIVLKKRKAQQLLRFSL